MNHYVNFIQSCNNQLYDPSEILIVQKVIENIDHLYNLNLSELAAMSFTSPSSISRFLKKIGYSSYSDFKEKVSIDYALYKPHTYSKSIDLDTLIQDTINDLDKANASIDLPRLRQLCKLILTSASVTLVGDYHSLEVFRVLYFTILMLGIPCFIFKRREHLIDHVKLLNSQDLIIYIHNDPNYQKGVEYNAKPKKALIEVNKLDPTGFDKDEIYHLITKGTDLYQSLTLLGNTLHTILIYEKEVMDHA